MTLSGVFRKDDLSVAAEVEKDLTGKDAIKGFRVGGSYKVDNKTSVKARFDSASNIGLVGKYKYSDAYSFSLGANIPLKAKADAVAKFLPFDCGF